MSQNRKMASFARGAMRYATKASEKLLCDDSTHIHSVALPIDNDGMVKSEMDLFYELLGAAGWHILDLIARTMINKWFAEGKKPKDPKHRFTQHGLEMQINFPGYEKDDLTVEVEDRKLYISGEGLNILEERDQTCRQVKLPANFTFDPESGSFSARNGQIKVIFPLSNDKIDMEEKNKGRFTLKKLAD